MTAAATVATAATSRLTRIASTRAGNLNGSFHAASENDFQTKLNLPTGSLKLYATTTKIGRNRYNSTTTATASSARPGQGDPAMPRRRRALMPAPRYP